ncbi:MULTISPECIES: MobC family plasmid mobilization relaxosome protein [Phocaeicola]|jgi:hypothetical protein|uniref:Plasmid mobilization relaxosome protein MobC n=2 Tax=Phocaeicola TaxID=909656 RepID=A0A412H5L8_9BACT|nr:MULTISPECIES: MobC family plasmid mobilization relaxosome protein [Phocaeicola]RGR98587.1 plasmid mobilization relaxosome protein MobC [Phocaeicola coprocola]RGS07285.1 plasmid mobilization relaxosome protein MobC [Phocaeicola plebeius]
MEQNREHKERNKGGRPKKEATEKLKYRVTVKMATADYFRLLTRAYEVGISPSEYMRECFRNGYVKGRLSEEHAGFIRQLCGMANNLNQLAHKANAGGFHDEKWNCKVAVARIHELITKIGI